MSEKSSATGRAALLQLSNILSALSLFTQPHLKTMMLKRIRDSPQLCKPVTQSGACITFKNPPSPSRFKMRPCKHG